MNTKQNITETEKITEKRKISTFSSRFHFYIFFINFFVHTQKKNISQNNNNNTSEPSHIIVLHINSE